MRTVEVTTLQMASGMCDAPARVDHAMSIHLSGPVSTICYEGQPRRKFIREPGGINLVPAGALSRWMIQAPLQAMYVRVPRETLSTVARDMGLDSDRIELRPAHQVRDERIEHIAHALRLEMADANPNGALFLEGLSLAMCSRLIGEFAGQAHRPVVTRGKLSAEQLKRIVDYIEDNLGSETLTLQHLAGVAGTSVSHLKTASRRALGKPLHRYVVERRVEKAALMLSQGAPISDAAAAAGFSHASHMSRWMQRLLRASPRQLRIR